MWLRHGKIRNVLLIVLASLVGGAAPLDSNRPDELSVVLTGQALMKSDFRDYAPEVVSSMRPLLSGDVVFTNYETATWETGDSLSELDPISGSYAPPEAFDALRDMGFNLLALSNNHSYDLGERGLLTTLKHVKSRKIAHAGIGKSVDEAAAAGFFQTRKGTVALVSMASGLIQRTEAAATETRAGLNQLHIVGSVPDAYVGFPSPEDAARILDNIKEADARADVVIAYHHNHVYDQDFVEMVDKKMPERFLPPAWIRGWARAQVDAGADIVALHGAPFIQGVELYRGKAIFYGLGNFIFELPPMHDHLFAEDAWRSVIADVRFNRGQISAISFRPIEMDPKGVPGAMQGRPSGATRGLPAPARGAMAATMLQELVQRSAALGTKIEVSGDGASVVFPSSLAN